jgi:hypothetical protein
MDPFQNLALQNSKLQTLLQDRQQATSPGSEMPPPPAYHTVVDPTAPLFNMHSPYDADDEDKDGEETPEINVNAMTQVRGHGNIISVAQMDSVRIANLIVSLLHGTVPPSPSDAPYAPQPEAASLDSTQTERPGAQRYQHDANRSRAWRRAIRNIPKINVTVNCGATIVGDRNIVGPGLGDIARQMQMVQAQRTQMAQRMAQQQQQQAAQHQQQQQQQQTTNIPNPGRRHQ